MTTYITSGLLMIFGAVLWQVISWAVDKFYVNRPNANLNKYKSSALNGIKVGCRLMGQLIVETDDDGDCCVYENVSGIIQGFTANSVKVNGKWYLIGKGAGHLSIKDVIIKL